MARPYKINAEYFSHDADMRNDVKVKALRRRFGLTGYAVWCFLLEALTDADSFEIEWTPTSRELYAADFDIAPEELDPILSYCESIGLMQRRGDIIFSEAHQRRLQAVSDRRMARATAGRLGGLRSGEARRAIIEAKTKQNEAMLQANAEIAKQNEAKESKGKETKAKESKEEDMVDTATSRGYPFKEVVELWNTTCSAFPKIVRLTDTRRAKIRSRLEEFSPKPEEYLPLCAALFARVQASAFLRGDNNHSWQATFDWLFANGSNWVKVLEGNYDDKGGYRPAPATARTQAVNGVTLGVGEYIDPTGRRTYGTGAATIPPTAPPRPSARYYWNGSTSQWTLQ